MRSLPLALAAAFTVALATPKSEAFSLSSISSLLANYGVNVTLPDRDINLPARAEEAASRALDRAETVLDRLFGEGGPLEDIDFPDLDLSGVDLPSIDLPDVDQIISDAKAKAAQAKADALAKVAEIKADAKARAEAALDKVASRVESVLDRLGVDLPDLGNVDLDNLPASLEDAQGVLDALLGSQSADVPSILASAPLENLPPVAITAIESALSHAGYYSLPVSASAAIPEPTSALLGAAGLVLAGVARRRR